MEGAVTVEFEPVVIEEESWVAFVDSLECGSFVGCGSFGSKAGE